MSDFLSIAGGMSLIPGAPLSEQLYYFMPKLTFDISRKVGIGGGLLFLPIPDETENISLAYGVTSFGKPSGALTLGVGFPLVSGTFSSSVLLVGADLQVSNSAKLITENWIFTGDDATTIFSGGTCK